MWQRSPLRKSILPLPCCAFSPAVWQPEAEESGRDGWEWNGEELCSLLCICVARRRGPAGCRNVFRHSLSMRRVLPARPWQAVNWRTVGRRGASDAGARPRPGASSSLLRQRARTQEGRRLCCLGGGGATRASTTVPVCPWCFGAWLPAAGTSIRRQWSRPSTTGTGPPRPPGSSAVLLGVLLPRPSAGLPLSGGQRLGPKHGLRPLPAKTAASVQAHRSASPPNRDRHAAELSKETSRKCLRVHCPLQEARRTSVPLPVTSAKRPQTEKGAGRPDGPPSLEPGVFPTWT
ncbi:hypothetical protein ACVW19_006846 [Streptomyces sp. TE5632]